MIRLSIRSSLIGTLLLLFHLPFAAHAQEKKEKKVEREVRVLNLQSVSPELASQVLQTMINSPQLKIAVDPRTNGLIAAGTSEQLEMIETLLLRLDQGEKASPKFFRLKYLSADEVVEVLRGQFGNPKGMQFQAFAKQNMILVSANRATMAEIAKLIEEIDRPTDKGILSGQNAIVYTYWIVDQDESKKHYPEWELKKIPESIKELVTEKLVPKTGIKNPMLAGQIAVQANIGNSVDNASKIQASGNGVVDSKNTFEVSSKGQVWNNVEHGSKIDIELEFSIKIVGDEKRSVESKVSTRIRTPLNHPVCLGLSPVNNIDSILITVVRDAD